MIVASTEEAAEASPREAAKTSLVLLPGRPELAIQVRDALLARGERAVVIDDSLIPDSAVAAVLRALDLAGVIAISSRALPEATIAEIEEFASATLLIEARQGEAAILRALAVTL
jgi:bifunctional enzyme CysN/CysC/sulfate adenylyltransferase subunit 1